MDTDAELLRRCGRDPQAFDTVYVRHAEEIHSWLLKTTGDASAALDMTAEVFARAWIERGRFRAPEDGSAGPWIQGIAKNVYRSWRHGERLQAEARARLRMRIRAWDMPADDDVLDKVAAERIGPDAMQRLLEIPSSQRDAIMLRVAEGLPYDEVARRLGCTQATARMRVMRGLRAIKAQVERGGQ